MTAPTDNPIPEIGEPLPQQQNYWRAPARFGFVPVHAPKHDPNRLVWGA